MLKNRPVVLIILDGWGYSNIKECNAIDKAKKPAWDKLCMRYPHLHIKTSGAAVGLPAGQMGNSEVGHLNIGAGRVVYQEFTRICRSVKTGSFFNNKTLTNAIDKAIDSDKALHILGLLSPGGVHSHEEHIHAATELAINKGLKKVYIHAFLDGRDTPPRSAMPSLKKLLASFEKNKGGQLCSIIGRFYAMDRDHRWPRIKAAYELITEGKAEFTTADPIEAIKMAYNRGESDEFVKATAICPDNTAPVTIDDGDIVLFMNYRSDRARQITLPFIEQEFTGFTRNKTLKLGDFISLTEYNKDYDIPVAFPPDRHVNVLGEHLSNLGLRQLRIAETEKYAHVTFFFNGGVEQPFEGEDRILIPSPEVTTYDLQPEMSAFELTEQLVDAIHTEKYDNIICNYANADMVGHTGSFSATVKAIEVLDSCLPKVIDATLSIGGELLITADHGNAEQMCGLDTGQPHTAHTSNPVPMIYIGNRNVTLEKSGALSDIAPTILHLMGIEQPIEMTGQTLFKLDRD